MRAMPQLQSSLPGRRGACLAIACALGLWPVVALSQDRPSEADLFADEPAASADAGQRDEGALFSGGDAPLQPGLMPDGGVDRDVTELSGTSRSKFDTDEVKADPLKIGANLNMFGQVLFQEGKSLSQEPVSLPILLETYLDGRPTERLRAYGVARVQYDPSRLAGTV
ncbi:MAG: hypothetical protein INH37_20910, partial [Myxococcaceae bacterium]|nr:hypothetical protein [Myxococcaceae bacterium]